MNENIDFPVISFEDFTKIHLCAGTIIAAQLNEKALKPAYILTIDFGQLGVKTRSAQITENYISDGLIGQQIIAVMNFPSKRVAGIKSEVLVLACVSSEKGTVLLQPTIAAPNGCRIL